jgi:hypothetical protein
MTERKSGLAFHVHHDRLAEWCGDYDDRVKCIKETKPIEEQELRLHLFKLIPNDRLPVKLKEAMEACNRAREAYAMALKARDKTLRFPFSILHRLGFSWKAWKAWGETWSAYSEALKAYYEALEASYEEILQLHQELCPDCPWDSTRKTIFTRRDVKGIWVKEESNVQA